MFRVILIASTLLISACDPTIQQTSGRAYLAAGDINDPDVAKFANYEPNLNFPARVGVVRLVYGDISSIPDKERDLYLEGLPESFGAIVKLGPLDAQMANIRQHSMDQVAIRQLAASRHLDYVLVLSFDPGKNSAEALFVDVRSGYPYASVEANPAGRGRTSFWGNELGNQGRLNGATYRLAGHLKPELEAMASGLEAEAKR